MTYEEKAKFLIDNGWETLWHKENWIKSEWRENPKINIDFAGWNTDQAYDICISEK